MKRPFFGVIAVGLLTTLGAVPKASADWWWHHSSPAPAGAGADSKYKHTKSHGRDPGMAKPVALYNSPKSFGWWHKYPGPMGAGGELVVKNQPAHAENATPQHSAQNTSTHHGLFGWLHRHHNEAPAAPTAPQPSASATSGTTAATTSDEQ
jgi:hypothetical protein